MNTRAACDWLTLIVILSIGAAPAAHCQTTFQTWPEIDVTWKFSDGWALFVQNELSGQRDSKDREATSGASIERRFNAIVSTAVGYRRVFSLAEQSPYLENRYLAELTTAAHPGAGLVFNDRNRYEYRLINGEKSWRYRNRLRVEKPLKRPNNSISPITPYGSEEVFYDSRYGFFSRVRVCLGVITTLSPRVAIDSYFAYQSDAQDDPPRRVAALGLKLQLTF